MRSSRRGFLVTCGVGITSSIAGCLDPPAIRGDTSDPTGGAAFFALQDWGNAVGGEHLAFEAPTEVGEMGHGWEPDTDIVPTIAEHDVFFYLDTPEFQWAVDVAEEIEREDSLDVHPIDGLAGIPEEELLPFDGHDREDHAEEDHDAEHDHDLFFDPHVWVDPVLADAMVGYLAEELGERFPDEADAFSANADAYREEIQGVHERFETLADAAALDVAVVVGHGAYQYLETRYDLEFHTPVGVTPNADASIDDLASLVETIDEYGIDTILYDPFESPDPNRDLPQAAQLLLEETDAAQAEPLTTTEGLLPAWQEDGYGWVELMLEVNVPSLERALRVDS